MGESLDVNKSYKNVGTGEIEYYEAEKPIREKSNMDSLISKLGKVELTKKKKPKKNVSFKP